MHWLMTSIANALILGSGVLSGVLTARLLGVEDRGLLAALIYWPHLLVGVTTLGLNESIVIRVARQGVPEKFATTVVTLSLSLAIVVTVLGAALMPWLLGSARLEHLGFTRSYLVLFAPSSFLAMNLLAIDQGRMDFRTFNIQRILQAVLYPILLLILWLTNLVSIKSAALSVVTGTVIVAGLRLWSFRHALWTIPSWTEARALLHPGWRIYSVDLLTQLSAQVDKMALVLLSNNAALGLYVAAQTLANGVQAIVTQTFINLVLPDAANASMGWDLATPLRRMLITLVLVSTVLILVLPWLVALLFGHEFAGATAIARVLTVAAAFAGFRKAILYVLRAKDIHRVSSLAESAAIAIIALGAFPAVLWREALGLALLVSAAQGISMIVILAGLLRETSMDLRGLCGLRGHHE